MGFFSGLISLFNYLLVLIFLFIVGFVAGIVAFEHIFKTRFPKAHMLMKTELNCQREDKASDHDQKEEDLDGVVWTK